MSLIEKFKNMDSWDAVKKEMEKHAMENNISMEELSSQITKLNISESHKLEPIMYPYFYKKASQPSKKSMPKEIKEACRSELWTQTKMNEFLEMQKKLGEPKILAPFEEIEKDENFSNYWNKGHPFVVYQLGTSSDTKIDSQR